MKTDYKAIVSKPDIAEDYDAGCTEFFDPWNDLFPNISGGYVNTMDILFIAGLKAVRDRKTYEFFELNSTTNTGFAAEMVLYIFDGHGITDCGISPRGGWPSDDIEPYLDEIIRKWEHYYTIVWGDDE